MAKKSKKQEKVIVSFTVTEQEIKPLSKTEIDRYAKMLREIAARKTRGFFIIATMKECDDGGEDVDGQCIVQNVNKMTVMEVVKQGLNWTPLEDLMSTVQGMAQKK